MLNGQTFRSEIEIRLWLSKVWTVDTSVLISNDIIIRLLFKLLEMAHAHTHLYLETDRGFDVRQAEFVLGF